MSAAAASLVAVLLAGAAADAAAPPSPNQAPPTVRALQAAMYPTHAGSGGCYKLLHARGESGCWSSGGGGGDLGEEDAPLAMWPGAAGAPSSPAVLVALAADAPALLARLARGHAKVLDDGDDEDARLARLVRGVIVVDRAAAAAATGGSGAAAVAPPGRYTSLPPFPYGAEYAPAPQTPRDYAWNPHGLPELDPLRFRLPVPVIAVPGAVAAAAEGEGGGGGATPSPAAAAALAFARDALRRAAANDAAAAAASGAAATTARARARHRAALSLGMTARGNSSACLAAGACKPLGGYSVLAALPPRRAAAAGPPSGADGVAAGSPPATRRRLADAPKQGQEQRQGDRAPGVAAAGAAPPSSSSSSSPKPLVLVVAQTDGYDLFHDLIRGSDAPLSGLVAMLAAAHALRASAQAAARSSPSPPPSPPPSWPSLFSARVAFLALAGEPWGYMGSRRFLYELETGEAPWAEAVLGPGASLADVSAVVEVGQVGRAGREGMAAAGAQGGAGDGDANKRQFFLHTLRDDEDTASRGGGLPLSLTEAFQQAASGANATLAARPSAGAAAGGRGLPPSSLYSFARVLPAPAPPLALLAEFDDRMDGRNPYFGGGRFDAGAAAAGPAPATAAGFDVASVASAATLLAAALQRLALPASAPAPNATAVREAVEAYAACLAVDVPGLACPLAGALMGPDAGPVAAGGGGSGQAVGPGGAAPPLSIPPPPRYVGVLQALPAPQPHGRELASPARKDALARFVWGALVASTMAEDEESSGGGGGGAGRCADAAAAERCVASGRVCAAPPATADSVFFGGPCVNASARYVPSYSLRVACAEGCTGTDGGGSGGGGGGGGGGKGPQQGAAPPFRWGEVGGAAAAAADAWTKRYGWPEDPMWTESDWPYGVPSARLYLADAPGAEAAALAAGAGVTAAAAAGGWWLRRRLIRAHVLGWRGLGGGKH